MPFPLIPFPLSIIFGLAFAAAWVAVLFKLGRKGKIYSILFKASLVAGFIIIVGIIYTTIANMLG
jgi:hypothetical protein